MAIKLLDLLISDNTTVADILKELGEQLGQLQISDNLGGRLYSTPQEIADISDEIRGRRVRSCRARECSYGYFVHITV